MKRTLLATVAAFSLAAAGTVQADTSKRTNISAKQVAHSAGNASGAGLNATEIMIIVTAVAVAGAVLKSGGAGSSMMTPFTRVSDARLKTDITRTGTSPSGIPVYSYRYGTAPEVYTGVLAQAQVDLAPAANEPQKNGYMAVDYGRIDVDFELIK